MTTLFDIIDNLDTAARIPAYRAIANSTLARAIGAIRQAIRDRKATERQDEAETGLLSSDQRTGHDEDERVGDAVAKLMRFEVADNPLLTASKLMAVHHAAAGELKTLTQSKWDAPMDVKGMLRLMTDNAQPISTALVTELAKIAKCKPEHIMQMYEIQTRLDRERLVADTPEIMSEIDSIGNYAHEGAIDEIPVVDRYTIAVKVFRALAKAKDQTLMRAMRSRSLANLGNIPLLEEGQERIAAFIAEFEDEYRLELSEAHEAGRVLPSIEDPIT